jgi:hypothetical protein
VGLHLLGRGRLLQGTAFLLLAFPEQSGGTRMNTPPLDSNAPPLRWPDEAPVTSYLRRRRERRQEQRAGGAPTDSHGEPRLIRRFRARPLVVSGRGQLLVVLVCVLIGALIGDVVSGGASVGPRVGGWIGYAIALFLAEIIGRRLDAAGRLPDWARRTEPIEPTGTGIDYSVPPPVDGPIFNGRADQALLQRWLQRRRHG